MCETANCIEVKANAGYGDYMVLISSTLNGFELLVTRDEWTSFVAAVKAGQFDDV
jgi:hypothetical protein